MLKRARLRSAATGALSVVLAASMATTLTPAAAFADDASQAAGASDGAVAQQEAPAQSDELDAAAPLAATSGSCGADATWSVSDNVLTISGTGAVTDPDWRGSFRDVVIEEGITSLCDSAFAEDFIERVTLPSTLTAIGDRAFQKCENLESINLEHVETIGNRAFENCVALSSVEFGDALKTIGDEAFSYSSGFDGPFEDPVLAEVVIPAGTQSIGRQAFDGQVALTSVVIEGCDAIGDYAFASCPSISSVTIRACGEMGRNLFSGVEVPMSVTLGGGDDTVAVGEESLTASAFWNGADPLIIESLSLLDGVVSIGESAFESADGLTSVAFPASCAEIASGAFRYCDSLSKVEFSEGLTTLGDDAFSSTAIGPEIVLPSTLASFSGAGADPFDGCDNLTSIEFLGSAPAGEISGLGISVDAMIYPAGNDTWTDEAKDALGGMTTEWYARQADGTLLKDTYRSPYETTALVEGEAQSLYFGDASWCDGTDHAFTFSLDSARDIEIDVSADFVDCYHGSILISVRDRNGETVGERILSGSDATEARASIILSLEAGDYTVEAIYINSHDDENAWFTILYGAYEYRSPYETSTLNLGLSNMAALLENSLSSQGGHAFEFTVDPSQQMETFEFSIEFPHRGSVIVDARLRDAAGTVIWSDAFEGGDDASTTFILPQTLDPGRYVFETALRYGGNSYMTMVKVTYHDGLWFSDVDYSPTSGDAWMLEWIDAAYREGLMSGSKGANGYLTGAFGPNGQLTRAQAVIVLYRAMTGASADEPAGTDTSGFVDVAESTYYTNAVNWAAANGVVSGGVDDEGNPDGRFRPDDTISRQELALMVWRAAGSPEAQDTSAYDATLDAATEWESATPAFQWTAEQGILSGAVEGGATYLRPDKPTLRGQASKIFVSSLPFLQQGDARYGNCTIDVADGTATVSPVDGTDGALTPHGDGYPWQTDDGIERVVFQDGSKVAGAFDCAGMFAGCSNLTSIDLSGLDTSEVTSMADMFAGCASLAEIDLSGFDTSSVANMGRMFEACVALSEIDLSGFDTSKVQLMNHMFNSCTSLTELDLSSFDTAACMGFMGMFQACSSLSELDLSGFDTSNAQTMLSMFRGCTSLERVDVSGFDTSKVTNFGQMFENCTSLTSLDLSSFDTSRAEAMYGMFSSEYEGEIVLNCGALRSVTLGPAFSFEGNGSMSHPCFLSTPSPDAVPGATGLWVNSAGEAFAPDEIPSNVADTYTAQVA